MRKCLVRKQKLFEDSGTELQVLERIEVASVKYGNGGYCSVNMEPLAVIVRHGSDSYAVDILGSLVPLDQLPEVG